MLNIKNEKSNNAYIPIKQAAKKRKIKNEEKENILKNDSNLVDCQTETKQLDLSISCDNIYEFIFENKTINYRFHYLNILTTYATLIMLDLVTLFLIGLFRLPQFTYEYECFSIHSYNFQRCTYRNLCTCNIDYGCLTICYDSRKDCRDYFVKNYLLSKERSSISNNIGHQLYVRFIESSNAKISIFKLKEDYCQLEHYFVVFVILYFVGEMLGSLIFGLIADVYGKKKVILINTIILVVTFFAISIAIANSIFNDYTVFWGITAFISGFGKAPVEINIYLNFLESYIDSREIKTINGFIHSHFAFSSLLFLFVNSLLTNFLFFYVFAIIYFCCFFFLYFFLFSDSPRFYSEKGEVTNKKTALEKMISRIMVIEKSQDNNKIEKKYWREIHLDEFSRKNNISDAINGTIKDSPDPLQNLRIDNNPDLGATTNSQVLTRTKIPDQRVLEFEKIKQKEIQNSDEQMSKAAKEIHKNKHKNEIIKRLLSDKFIRRNIVLLTITWMTIHYLSYGAMFNFILNLSNPNFILISENIGTVAFNFFVLFIVPIIIGKSSGWVVIDSKYFIMLTTFIYSIMTIFMDSNNIRSDSERLVFFSHIDDVSQYLFNPVSISISSALIFSTYSLFNLIIVTSVPTLYRSTFVSSVMAFSKLTAILSCVSFKILDTPLLNLGIIAFLLFFVFFCVNIKWKDITLFESVDVNENDEGKKIKTIKKKINSKISKIITTGKMSTRTYSSIFSRLKDFSIKTKHIF